MLDPKACPICKGARFVWENHPPLAWPEECDCGAGNPCSVCNVAEPPAIPDDFIRDIEAEALYEALDEFAKKVKSPPH